MHTCNFNSLPHGLYASTRVSFEELEEKREVRLLIQGITSKEHIERVIAAIQTIKGVISVGVDIKESEAVAIVKKM